MALATNLQLTYDDATNQWNFTEVAYDYGAQTAPSWSGYTATDPAFEYATEGATTTATTDSAEGDDPCPPGYVYDNNLKQCVSDPTYEAPAYAGQPKGEYSSEAGPSERIQESTYGAGYPQTMGQFTSTDMRSYGIEKGFVDEFGNVSKPAAEEGFLGTIANLGRQTDYDQYINHLKKKGLFNEDIVAGNPMGTGKILSRSEDYATSISPEKFLEQYGVEGEVGKNDIYPDYGFVKSRQGAMDWTQPTTAPTPTFVTRQEGMDWTQPVDVWSNYALGITAPSYGQRQPFFRQQDVSGGATSIGERMQHEQEQLKEKQEEEKLKQQRFKTQRELTRLEKERRELGPSPQLTSEQRQPSKFTAVEKERRQARQAADKAMENAAKRESAAIRGGNKQAAQRARSDYQTAVERAGYSRK